MNFGAITPLGILAKFTKCFGVEYKTKTSILDPVAREAEGHLSAFIVYEDVATGKRAKETCDGLAQRSFLNWKLRIKLFSFKSLGVLEIRREAAAAATSANLVIFSCYLAELPMDVWEWIELFLRRPLQPTALVALFAQTFRQAEAAPRLEKYLAGVAQRRGMTYFSHIYKPMAEDAFDLLRPDGQKEPNEDSEREIEIRDYRSRGLQKH
jgi:hypothetical protein